MRLAWFSPLPPDPSGIAAYSSEVLPLLESGGWAIDRFIDRPPAPDHSNVFNAHDFVWKHQRAPYDLVVYQVGNARWHDYMWAYLAAYPGLVVLHDTRLHHARARHLLIQGRPDDYRREFRYDHPDAPPGVEEFAVEGLSGSTYYLWSMLPVVLRTARLVAVHNVRVAEDLHRQYPDVRVDPIRMGVPPCLPPPGSAAAAKSGLRRELRIADTATVFVAFGHVTPEKRIEPVLGGLADLVARGTDAHLVLVGQAAGMPSLQALIAARALDARVHAIGYVPDDQIAACFASADVCMCLRWPTAGETSASWLRALSAGTPTVITALAHLADVPTMDALTARRSHRAQAPVAVSVDLLDEAHGVGAAMARLSADAQLRSDLSSAGHAHWWREHRLELMADDYRRVIQDAAARPAPGPDGLPSHFTDDYSALVKRIEEEMGVNTRLV